MGEREVARLGLRQLGIVTIGGLILLVALLALGPLAGSPGGAALVLALLAVVLGGEHWLLRHRVLQPVIAAARADHDRLAASEARFAAAAEAMPDGLAIFDAEERLVYHNRHYPDLLAEPYRLTLELGQPIDRWVERARRLGPIYHPEMGEDFLERRLALKLLASADHEHRLADGRWMRVRERRMAGGGRILLVTDITAAREQEAAIRASGERFRSIVDDQVEFISRFGPDLTITFVNEAYARQLGRPREALVGSSLLDLMSPEQQAQFRAQLEGLTPERPTVAYEMVGTRADGSPAIEAWVDRALYDHDGRLLEYQSVGRDVTDERQAQARLKDSESRFRAIAESVPMPVVITALGRRAILFANSRARAVFDFGEPGAELDQGRIWVDVGERERIARRVAAEGYVEAVEVRLKRADGGEFDAMLSVRLMDYGGEPAALGAIADISELRRAEEALRASEARLAAFMAHAPVAMCLEDPDGRFLMCNPEMGRILGRPAAEAIGRTARDFFPPAEAEEILANIMSVLESGEPMVVEEHQPSLEAYAWATVIRFPIKDAAGKVVGVGGFAVDTTAQKRAQAELEASEQRFRTIAELHPIPLVITRLADRSVLFANRAFYETFRLDPARLMGDFHRADLYEDQTVREEIFATIRAGRSFDNRELVMRDTEGRTFPVIFDARPMLYDGQVCIVTSVRDVSELKAAEAEIRRQREVLHQTEKLSALGTLLAGVAHELNNPLSVVVGHASLLREQAHDPGTRTRAERIHTAAERCARIVKTFLAMARQKPPSWGVVRAEEAIEGALELVAYQLRTAGVVVERDLPDDLPAVWGDADQLHQVLANLVVNAHQALLQVAPPRRLALRARRLGAREVAITVEDNGPGMREEVRKRVFEPFFTTKPQGVGTGIGLAVCHAIVTAHRGRIQIDSAPGAGTRMTVILPVAEAAPAPSAAPAEIACRAAPRARVLVVDDEPEIVELVGETLRGEGYAVDTAASGRVALDRLSRHGVDAIVTDLRMPDVDGVTLLRELERRDPDLTRRVVVVTGDALSAEVTALARESGLTVLEKPLDLEVLKCRLRDLLGSCRPAGSADRPSDAAGADPADPEQGDRRLERDAVVGRGEDDQEKSAGGFGAHGRSSGSREPPRTGPAAL